MKSLGELYLDKEGASYTSWMYVYREKGAQAAGQALGIPVHTIFKTLVVKLSECSFVFLIVPGHTGASLKQFARIVGVKNATLSTPQEAERITGYKVGGIGPFGSRSMLPVYADLSILDHDAVYINGGRRGLLLKMDPEELLRISHGEVVEVCTI